VKVFVQIAQALNLETVAEGIEQSSELQALQSNGCQVRAGILFSRPLNLEALQEFFENTEHGNASHRS